jgi:hypothetical protein
MNVPDGAKVSIDATGDSKLGKGVLGPIPIHLIARDKNIELAKGKQLKWELTLELLK